MKNVMRRNQQPPLLLTTIRRKQYFYSPLENRHYHTRRIPILNHKRVVGSSHGWLVLLDPTGDNCCLWNPKSAETIRLPWVDSPFAYSRCVLSRPPTEPNCHILFNASGRAEQSFCRIGDLAFSHHLMGLNECRGLVAIGSHRGEIYGVVEPGYKFVNVHFVGQTLELRPMLTHDGQPWSIPQADRDWVTWHESHMMYSPLGELLLVMKMYTLSYRCDGLEFRVFRVDIDRMECVEMESIGELTIYVAHWGEGFCRSSRGMKTNSIYYKDEGGGVVYIYDLENRSTTSLEPISYDEYDTSCQPFSSWVDGLQGISHRLFH